MDIIIDKQDIYRKVSMNVSVVARDLIGTNGNSIYDKVRIQDRDNELLDSYYTRIEGELTLILRDFIVRISEGKLCLYLDDNVNPYLSKGLESLISEYITNRIVSEWLKLKSVENSPNFQSAADNLLNTIQEKLYYRNTQSDEDITNNERHRCNQCHFTDGNGKRIHEVILFKNVILNDIDKELFSMYKTRKQYADAIQPGKLESHAQLSVYISKHTKRITERMAAYIISFKCCSKASNNTERVPSFIYTIGMPSTWNTYNLEQLAEEMHSYIVNASLFDYIKINFPDEALIFKGASDAAWDNIKHTLSVRRGGIKKPLQPF